MKPPLLALGLLGGVISRPAAPAAIPPRHLFLDPAFVREAQGAALVVNPPKSSEIVIRADKPWEQFMITFYLTVIDEGGNGMKPELLRGPPGVFPPCRPCTAPQ